MKIGAYFVRYDGNVKEGATPILKMVLTFSDGISENIMVNSLLNRPRNPLIKLLKKSVTQSIVGNPGNKKC